MNHPVSDLKKHDQYVVFNNFGAGLESCVGLLEWVYNPDSRPIDPNTGQPVGLHQIVTLFAMTGQEYPRTKAQVEKWILPVMREHNMRLIIVGRKGTSFKDGLAIVRDTRTPKDFPCTEFDAVIEDLATIRDEWEASATLPKLGRPHSCAMKWKGWGLDWVIQLYEYLARIYGAWEVPELHESMLSALMEETKHLNRWAKRYGEQVVDNQWQEWLTSRHGGKYDRLLGFDYKPLLAGPVLWFNYDERGRMTTSNEYGCRGQNYLYPAIEWRKNRSALDRMGREFTIMLAAQWGEHLDAGHEFDKSACASCPFPEKEYQLARAALEPAEYAGAVLDSDRVIRLNQNMHHYGWGTSYWVATQIPKVMEWYQILKEDEQHRYGLRVIRIRRIVDHIPAPTSANPKRWRVDSVRCIDTVSDISIHDDEYAVLTSLQKDVGGDLHQVTKAQLQELRFRSPGPKINNLPAHELKARTLAGADLRGRPYLGWRKQKSEWSQFIVDQFWYLEVQPRDLLTWPRAEEAYVVVCNNVQDKVVNADKFEEAWDELHGYGQQCLF